MKQKLKPAINKKWLLAVSGIMWSGVGVLLNWVAAKWLPNFELWQIISIYVFGIVISIAISNFGFNKLAEKNRDRILGYPEKVCIFAFQRWQMYLLIIVMMSMGFFMRTTDFIPKYLLAPFYVGIGLALFISSFIYYKSLFRLKD
ncbi:MAG: hypothetical protein ABFS12_03985 [Bacteroidota bacterium]